MSDDDQAAVDAQVVRDMEWTAVFLQEILADPSILDEIPDGASVHLLPDDDPELAEANLRGAERSRQRGYPVYLRRMPSHGAAENGRKAATPANKPAGVAPQRPRGAVKNGE